jgi:hypothetical protein
MTRGTVLNFQPTQISDISDVESTFFLVGALAITAARIGMRRVKAR